MSEYFLAAPGWSPSTVISLSHFSPTPSCPLSSLLFHSFRPSTYLTWSVSTVSFPVSSDSCLVPGCLLIINISRSWPSSPSQSYDPHGTAPQTLCQQHWMHLWSSIHSAQPWILLNFCTFWNTAPLPNCGPKVLVCIPKSLQLQTVPLLCSLEWLLMYPIVSFLILLFIIVCNFNSCYTQ